ncbi:calmodulin [Hydra vulgaris]|uniref:Calmodulin n=1 Tax=Hydra vulgaris TaxID=6087 RepID=A0ABM4CVB6_HYDVU
MDKLSEEQIKEFRDAFTAFDKDNNGFITSSELVTVLRSLGLNPTEKEICRIINEVDFDGNGKIDFSEFVSLMTSQGDQMAWSDNDLVEAFRTFDTEDEGFISAIELFYVLNRLDDNTVTSKDIEDLVKTKNLNTNRKIDFNEFKKLARPEINLPKEAIMNNDHLQNFLDLIWFK